MPIQRLESGPVKSEITLHGGLAYIAGQTAADPVPSAAEQTRQVLAQLDALLARAGTSKERLLSVTVCLAHMGDFEAMNTVWKSWVPAGQAPCRATIVAAPAAPGLLVEMMGVAAV